MADSWFTPVAILALLAYGWFALTKKVNRRTITVDSERLRAWDGPLYSLARKISVPVEEVGRLETNRRSTLTMPPTQIVRTFSVDARGVRGHIIKKLPTKEEADKAPTLRQKPTLAPPQTSDAPAADNGKDSVLQDPKAGATKDVSPWA